MVAATEDDQLLRDLPEFPRQRRPASSEPRKGSYEAIARVAGTLSHEDAQEVMRISKRAFNNIEGEWQR